MKNQPHWVTICLEAPTHTTPYTTITMVTKAYIMKIQGWMTIPPYVHPHLHLLQGSIFITIRVHFMAINNLTLIPNLRGQWTKLLLYMLLSTLERDKGTLNLVFRIRLDLVVFVRTFR